MSWSTFIISLGLTLILLGAKLSSWSISCSVSTFSTTAIGPSGISILNSTSPCSSAFLCASLTLVSVPDISAGSLKARLGPSGFPAVALCIPLTAPPNVPPNTRAKVPASTYSLKASSSAGLIGSPACARSNTCCIISVGTSVAPPLAIPVATCFKISVAVDFCRGPPYLPITAYTNESAAD